MKSAYIYYRVDPAQVHFAAARIDALLNAMAAHCKPPPRRQQRCDDPLMWMEIYQNIANFSAFKAALEAAVQRLGCQAFIRGERHLECFSGPECAP